MVPNDPLSAKGDICVRKRTPIGKARNGVIGAEPGDQLPTKSGLKRDALGALLLRQRHAAGGAQRRAVARAVPMPMSDRSEDPVGGGAR